MSNDDYQAKGTVLNSDDFAQALAASEAVSRDVDQILEKAKRDAADILKSAEIERDRQLEVIHARANERFIEFISEEELRVHALAFKKVTEDVARIKNEFDRIEPWLIALVTGCLRKILGRLDIDEIVARMVRQAVSELKSCYQQELLVHPNDEETVLKSMAEYSEFFNGVSRLMVSPDVTPGTLRLENEICGTVLDLEAQFSILLDTIATSISSADDEAEGSV